MASSNGWFLTSAIKRVFEKFGTPPAILPTRSSRMLLRRKPLFEGLEHRLLLSADPVGALGASTDPTNINEPVVSAPLNAGNSGDAGGPAVSGAPPVGEVDMYVVKEDEVLTPSLDESVLANDSGDTPLKARPGDDPVNGTLTLNENGTFTYTPKANYFGIDSFSYYVEDVTGQRSLDPVMVTISVEGVNDAPVAHDDTLRTAVDTPLSISFGDLLGNDFDADGDTLQVSGKPTDPSYGTLEEVDGGYVYHPNDGFTGEDFFFYSAMDDLSTSSPAKVFIVVKTNAAPVANADEYSTSANTPLTVTTKDGLLANDSDPDEDTLAAILVSGPSHGVLDFGEDGSFKYTPNTDFAGTDTFTYRASDGDLASEALVTIQVQPTNSAPVAKNDGYSIDEDTKLVVAADVGLLANDSDADNDQLVAHLVSGPAHGELKILEDGSFMYTPGANFNGADSFTYKVSDGKLESAVATVSLQVNAVNDTPAFASTPNTSFTIDADAASFDGDGVFRVAGAPGEAAMMAALGQPMTAPGAAGQTVNVQFDWTFREAMYNNEVGIYRVIDKDGRVGDLRPGDAGYAKAALAANNSQVVFASGAGAGAHLDLQLEGGAMYAFYVIQNGKTSTFLSGNPSNVVGAGPLAFFSIAKANPDGFDHVHAEIQPQTGTLNFRWEDLTRGGDADYNDVVMTAKGLAVSADEAVYTYNASAQDADGDALMYRLADGPQGAYIDAKTGVLHWAAAPGKFHFAIEASDGNGAVTKQAFDLTVDTRSTDLVVKGTGANDRIEVWEHDGGLVTVRVNDIARTYSHVSSLRVDALGGDDQVVLRSLTMKATVDAGDGNDCIDASAVTQIGVVLYGGAGNDRLTGGAGNDRMDGGSGSDELNGGAGNDLLVGGQGQDCLNGGDGNDLLDGGADNDQLRGGTGNDLLVADSGDDYLKGEDGNDILIGGSGNDSNEGNYGADLIVDGPGCDSNGYISSHDRVVDGTSYGIPTTLPAQPPGPVVDWSSRYVALVSALQQFRDQPSNPQWWQDFVNNLGQPEAAANPNSQIRVVGPGADS